MSQGNDTTGFLGRFSRTLMPFEDAANMLAAIAIFLLMLLGVAQITLRSVFNAPITGYEGENSLSGLGLFGVPPDGIEYALRIELVLIGADPLIPDRLTGNLAEAGELLI